MSAEATTWAKYVAGVKKHWVSTLAELADLADEAGKGARPTQEYLAWATRKTTRAIRDDLAAMEEAGLIRKGDQRMVAHLPPDRRPVVWDLATEMPLRRRPPTAPSGLAFPDRAEADFRPVPDRQEAHFPPVPDRQEADFRPVDDTGRKHTSARSGDRPEADYRPEAHFRSAYTDQPGHNPDRAEAHFRQKKEEEEKGLTTPPPTPEPKPGGDAAAELTADEAALIAEVCSIRPDWSPVSVRKVVVSAEIRERTDRALVRLAFLIVADDRKTTTPNRLLHDACPAWRRALAELYPPPSADDPGDREPVDVLGAKPWCGDDGCDKTTRILVDPLTGAPLPGRRRCPRCHPQSPAVQP